jgi:hypothetical protein
MRVCHLWLADLLLKFMMRRTFRIVSLLVFLGGILASGCKTADTQAKQPGLQSPLNIATPETKSTGNKHLKTPMLYLQDPLEFDNEGMSKITIFYEDGSFGIMRLKINKKDKEKIELSGIFDDIVAYGKWKNENGQLDMEWQKCRCLDCGAKHSNDLRQPDLINTLPLTQNWSIEKGNFAEPGNIIKSQYKKFRPTDKNEFVFANYDGILDEPQKVRDYNSDQFCTAWDLVNFDL